MGLLGRKFVIRGRWIFSVIPLLLGVPVFAAPTAGTILRQSAPQPMLPVAPGPVITLPAPKAQARHAAVKIPLRRTEIHGNTLLPSAELAALVQSLQDRTVTLGELDAAVERITALYHKRGYPLAYAYLPVQTIRHGVVRIQVVEPRYDHIELKGRSRLKSGQARRTLDLKVGAPIRKTELERGLLLLDQTPGVHVAGTFVPGAKPATSTLEVGLSDTPLLRATASLDNQGSDSSGRTRGLVDLSLNDPFGYGGQLAVNGMTTAGGLLHAGGFSLLTPDLRHGLRASLYGSHTSYQLGGAFADLQESGSAEQYGLDLNDPVILENGRVLNARLDLVRNRFRQDSAAAGAESRSHLDLVRFGLSGGWSDALGESTAGALNLSRGRLTLDSAEATGPAGAFWVGSFRVERSQSLFRQYQLRVGLSAQLASHNLDGSQKFFLGGPDGVMSYPVNEAGGDQGVLLTTRLAHVVPLATPGQMEAALLMQWGEIKIDHSPSASGPNHRHLAGAGLGLDYRLKNNVVAQLDYVRRLGSDPPQSGPNHQGELWACLQLAL